MTFGLGFWHYVGFCLRYILARSHNWLARTGWATDRGGACFISHLWLRFKDRWLPDGGANAGCADAVAVSAVSLPEEVHTRGLNFGSCFIRSHCCCFLLLHRALRPYRKMGCGVGNPD